MDSKSLAKKNVSLIDKGNFCRYLGTMIRTGTPILEAVDLLSEQSQNKTLSLILKEVKGDLEKGKPLGVALSKFPKAFNVIFLTIVEAGEQSGTLDKSLEYLGKQQIADYYLVQKVKGSMLYPLVIVSAMTVMGFLIIGFVLPRIATVFLASGFPIPFYTQAIFSFSLFVSKYIFIIMPAFAGAVFLLCLFFLKGRGKDFIISLLPKIPVIKKVFSDLDLARFGRILGTLLQTGVPIVEGLKIATAALTLPKYKRLGAQLELEVAKGASMKEVLKKEGKDFPKMMVGMIAIGEETGSLEKVLFDIADFYDQEVDNSLKNFATVLEPVLMVVVGIGVAIMVLAIITPIYSLVGNFKVQ